MYDFSNSGNVSIQTVQFTDGPFGDVIVHGDFAYVGAGPNLYAVNLAGAPIAITAILPGDYSHFWWRFSARSDDTLLYVANNSAFQPSSGGAFTIINIANPANPVVVAKQPVAVDCFDVFVVDSFLLVSNYFELQVYNVASPATPAKVGSLPVNYRAGAMCGENGNLILTDWGPDFEFNWDEPEPIPMYLCDLSQLPKVSELGRYVQANYSKHIAATGKYCYIGSDYNMGPDIAIIDVSDPVNPQTVNTIETPGDVRDIKIEEDRLFVMTSQQMSIYDLNNPSSPLLVEIALGDAWEVRLTGEYALIAAYGAGLRVFDIQPPESTHFVTRLSTPAEIHSLAILGDYLYASSTWVSYVIDISNPASPVVLSSWGDGGGIIDILPDGRLIDWGQVVRVFSLQDPLHPSLDFYYGQSAWRGAISADTLFMVRDLAGVEAAVLGPYGLTRVAEYFTPGQSVGIARNGKHTYLADLYSLLVFSDDTPSDVTGDSIFLPTGFWVSQNYPNPFNPGTTIEFTLDQPSRVTISIFNSLGQVISTTDMGFQAAGSHSVGFNAANVNLASGVYFYRVSAGRKEISRKMVLLK